MLRVAGINRERVNCFSNLLNFPFIKKKKAEQNPWGEGATTLEWDVSSPPPFHTFEELPKVK